MKTNYHHRIDYRQSRLILMLNVENEAVPRSI